jgi:cytidylate kinase
MSGVTSTPAEPPGAARVVTISATFGAGGSVIAPGLARRLGLPFINRLLPADVSVPADLGGEGLSAEEREHSPAGRFVTNLAHLGAGLGFPVAEADDLDPIGRLRRQVELGIAAVTESSGGVILGRAGAIVLADHDTAFHVRLDGPERHRVRLAMTIEQVDEETARRRQVEVDRVRSRYVNRVYNCDPADPALYHLVLDTTAFSFDDCIDVLAAAATAHWRHAASG